MKRILTAAAFAAFSSVGFFAPEANAGTVTYSTVGSQLCIGASGCGVATQTIGGASGITVTYVPVSGPADANPSTFIGLGSIEVRCAAGGTACGSQSLAGLNLYINLGQTGPTPGNGSLPALSFSGSISGNSSGAFGTTSTVTTALIGAVTYRYFNANVFLNPPSSGTTAGIGRVFITGFLTDESPVVPVPAALPLLLSGLAGIGFAARKKKAA